METIQDDDITFQAKFDFSVHTLDSDTIYAIKETVHEFQLQPDIDLISKRLKLKLNTYLDKAEYIIKNSGDLSIEQNVLLYLCDRAATILNENKYKPNNEYFFLINAIGHAKNGYMFMFGDVIDEFTHGKLAEHIVKNEMTWDIVEFESNSFQFNFYCIQHEKLMGCINQLFIWAQPVNTNTFDDMYIPFKEYYDEKYERWNSKKTKNIAFDDNDITDAYTVKALTKALHMTCYIRMSYNFDGITFKLFNGKMMKIFHKVEIDSLLNELL